MSLISFFENLFSDVETDLTKIEAGFATANNFIGVVLGQVQAADAIVTAVDPALGAAIAAGVAALKVLQSDIAAGVSSASSDATTLGNNLASLGAQAMTLSVQVAPFVNVVAKDVAAVDSAAVSAVQAVTAPVVAA